MLLLERSFFYCDNTDILDVLGNRIHSMMVNDRFEPGVSDFRLSLSTKCRNVKKLTIGLKYAGAFFASPKPNLEQLLVNNIPDEHIQDILRIAQNSGGLRYISLQGSMVSYHTLQQLARLNANIETVAVYVRGPGLVSGGFCSACMIRLIECFVECELLKEVCLDFAGWLPSRVRVCFSGIETCLLALAKFITFVDFGKELGRSTDSKKISTCDNSSFFFPKLEVFPS